MLNLSPSPNFGAQKSNPQKPKNTPWARMQTPASRTMSGQVGGLKVPLNRPNPNPKPMMPSSPIGPQMGPGMNIPEYAPGGEIKADMPGTAGSPPSMIMPPSSMPVLYGQGGGINTGMSGGMNPMSSLWANYNRMMGGGSSPTGNLFY